MYIFQFQLNRSNFFLVSFNIAFYIKMNFITQKLTCSCQLNINVRTISQIKDYPYYLKQNSFSMVVYFIHIIINLNSAQFIKNFDNNKDSYYFKLYFHLEDSFEVINYSLILFIHNYFSLNLMIINYNMKKRNFIFFKNNFYHFHLILYYRIMYFKNSYYLFKFVLLKTRKFRLELNLIYFFGN